MLASVLDGSITLRRGSIDALQGRFSGDVITPIYPKHAPCVHLPPHRLNIMSLSVWDFLAVIIALVIVRWLHVQRTRAKASNLPHPPGPPGLPLIGNLRDIPPNPAWLTYRQCSRAYCELESMCSGSHNCSIVCFSRFGLGPSECLW